VSCDSGPPTKTSGWALRATLKDGQKPVTDVQFAPRHLGLKLVRVTLVKPYRAAPQ
jgi:hypothetical protein